jgi:predicted N-formylglutamate amidohydrolase
MSDVNINAPVDHVSMVNAAGSSSVVLVCEHASDYIPQAYNGLGLSSADRKSHAVWDPGAMALAKQLSMLLDAVLIAGGVSRLVYDCNRPPNAPDAMPERSEIISVLGNLNLTQSERDARVESFYRPFNKALDTTIARVTHSVIVTIHSFTPVYHGIPRAVEIGILHDSDTRLADAMLDVASTHTSADVRRNEPYGPEHGVTHTLREHGLKGGHLNVMLEVRNDLVETPDQQASMGALIAKWIVDACAQMSVPGDVQCRG